MILGKFLPMEEITEKEFRLLYADGSRKNDIKFNFEDTVNMRKLSFIGKLKEVDFRDTFRDEPFLYHFKLLSTLFETTQTSVKDGEEL